jgi:hypothetical protein
MRNDKKNNGTRIHNGVHPSNGLHFWAHFSVERPLYYLKKIVINTWKYLNSGDALKIHYSDPNSNCTSGFVARNHAQMTINSSNSVTITSKLLLGSLHGKLCLYRQGVLDLPSVDEKTGF